MGVYKVKSGQNIFDVALTLYGSVEGIVDLLASNDINMDTDLSAGMELNYTDDYTINPDIVRWLKSNEITVKNGHHVLQYLDISEIIQNHINQEHPDITSSLQNLSPDEVNLFWAELTTPKIVVDQTGSYTSIKCQLKSDTHMIIDWGDYTDPEIIDGGEYQEIEHCFKGSGRHKITIYGECRFTNLDFTELNGIYYPLNYIYADTFVSALKLPNINQLIIVQQ